MGFKGRTHGGFRVRSVWYSGKFASKVGCHPICSLQIEFQTLVHVSGGVKMQGVVSRISRIRTLEAARTSSRAQFSIRS
jgi:hypothetical protein